MHPYIIEECSFVSSSYMNSKEIHTLLFFQSNRPTDLNIAIDKHPILWLLYIINK